MQYCAKWLKQNSVNFPHSQDCRWNAETFRIWFLNIFFAFTGNQSSTFCKGFTLNGRTPQSGFNSTICGEEIIRSWVWAGSALSRTWSIWFCWLRHSLSTSKVSASSVATHIVRRCCGAKNWVTAQPLKIVIPARSISRTESG